MHIENKFPKYSLVIGLKHFSYNFLLLKLREKNLFHFLKRKVYINNLKTQL